MEEIEIDKIEVDTIYSGTDYNGSYYNYRSDGYEIECKDITIYVELDIYHWPDIDKNSINIDNIDVFSDDGKVVLWPDEHEILYKKIHDAIEVVSTNY